MKLWLSKPEPITHKRHLVLDVEPEHYTMVQEVLIRNVLQGARPLRKIRQGRVRYRFATRYLDRLVLAFPTMEMSPAVTRLVARIEEVPQDEPVPDLGLTDWLRTPYNYQLVGASKMLKGILEENAYMNLDDLGLGKTTMVYIVIDKLIEAGVLENVLVVAPKNGQRVWLREAEKCFGEYLSVEVIDYPNKAQCSAAIRRRADVTVVNPEKLRIYPELLSFRYDLLVVDEFHRFANPEALWTEKFQEVKTDNILLLSNTPIPGKPEDMWVGLNKGWPDVWPSYWAMKTNLHLKRKGKLIGLNPDAMGKLRTFIREHSVRRNADQVIADRPQTVPMTIQIELNREQRRLYNRIKDEFKLELANGEVRSVTQAMTHVTRLRQACFSPELYGGSPRSAKLDELQAQVKQLVEAGHKALIGSAWSKATRILQREFAEYNPAYVDGSITGKKREAEQDRFNEDDECKLYIGTIKANKEAISLNAATWVFFTDREWRPIDNDQFVGRSAAGGLRGAGYHGTVTVANLHAMNTIEEHIDEILFGKRKVAAVLLDQDRGALVTRSVTEALLELLEADSEAA